MSESVKEGSFPSNDLYLSGADPLAVRPDRMFPLVGALAEGCRYEKMSRKP